MLETNENQIDNCDKISAIIHELAQSVLVINAYIGGCSQRLKDNTLSNEQLADILLKIYKHTQIISDKLPELSKNHAQRF